MNQIESAQKNIITDLIKYISVREGLPSKKICEGLASGTIVLLKNRVHKIKRPCAIGKGLSTKINANIGTSTAKPSLAEEINKLKAALKYGADTVMDLSVGRHLERMRSLILKFSDVPVGTVPIYEAAVNAQESKGSFLRMSGDEIISVFEKQARQGVDFFTVHAGITKKSLQTLKTNRRLMGIVSRGGAILASWMEYNKKENPLYEHFDKILKIAYELDVTLSLGDALRPGSVLDATDKPQISELKILGELTKRARKQNVQVIVEGPGHVPLHQIERNVALEKKICHQAPFYVLGPLVTDVAAGYDHISSSIGAAVAAGAGADFLCYVTPSEHLRHPTVEDVREGVIASRIAAHSADIVKGVPGALRWDKQISQARKMRDWRKQISLSIDPDKARMFRGTLNRRPKDVCTMCGEYCSIKLMEECLRA